MKKAPKTARQALEAARDKPSRQALSGQASVEAQLQATWAAQQTALEATRAEQAHALEAQREGQREALAAARQAEAEVGEEQRCALEAMRAQQQAALEATRAALEVQRAEQDQTLEAVRRGQNQALQVMRAEKAEALEAMQAEQRRALEAQREGQRRALEETRAGQDQALLRLRLGGATSPMRYAGVVQHADEHLQLAGAVRHGGAVQHVGHAPLDWLRHQSAASSTAAKAMPLPAKSAPPVSKAPPAKIRSGGRAVTSAEAAARAIGPVLGRGTTATGSTAARGGTNAAAVMAHFEAALEAMRRRHQLGEDQREAGNRDVAQVDAKHDEESPGGGT